jgi:long-chain acyl-CoA synthetase
MNTTTVSSTATTTDAHSTDSVPRPLYVERTPLAPDEPQTLAGMIASAAARHAKPDALSYKKDGAWQAISSDEMLARMHHIALGLHALGITKGDRIAILSANRPEWTLTDGGALLAGVVDVPIYTTQTPTQVCYILKDSGARVLFIENIAAYRRIEAEIRTCSTLERIVFFDGAETGEINAEISALTIHQVEDHGRALAAERPMLADELLRAVEAEDLATIIYTSGTTGDPKGVMLTHRNFVTNVIDSGGHLSFNSSDVVLSVLPLSHVFERLAMYMYLHYGMSVFFAEAMDKVGDNMREVRPTILIAVPRLFEKIYARIKEKAAAGGKVKSALLAWAVETGKSWARLTLAHKPVPFALSLQHKLASKLVFTKWHEATGGRLRLFISGGAALPEELGYIFSGAGLPIVQGYGLTETAPVICAAQLDDNRIGTVGKPIKNVSVRLAADGEIEVAGPNVMRGYYNKPDATRAAFTEDGWFRTGDIGTLDADGFLRITDRKKELFKTSGGKYVAPQPIEGRIKQSRFVSQVVLVGNERKFPAALIVPDWEQLRSYAKLKNIPYKEDAELCEHPRIIDLLQRQVDGLTGDLAQYEKVKKVALLPKELTTEGGEMTPTLKVKRRVVDEKYKRVIDKLYEETMNAE